MSLRQMMAHSSCFKCSLVLGILMIVSVVVLNIVWDSITCVEDYSCEWWYPGQNQVDCYYYGDYCCPYNVYANCDSRYCSIKPIYVNLSCVVIFIAMLICSGLAFFLTITVLIMFCQFRRRARDPIFNQAGYGRLNDPNLYQPQPQYYPNQNNYPPNNSPYQQQQNYPAQNRHQHIGLA
jgi:hypothetical protein